MLFLFYMNKVKRILLLCNCQYDYVLGPMATPGATWCMDQLTDDIFHTYKEYYEAVCFDLEIHPINHCSFVRTIPHCIEHGLGSTIYEGVYNAVCNYGKPILYFVKGNLQYIDESSILNNTECRKRLLQYINNNSITQIDIAGPATPVFELVQDFCDFNQENKLNVLLKLCPRDESYIELKKFLIDRKINYML